MPDISAYVTAHKDKVAAIGLAFEDSDKADIEKYLKAHPLSYPVAQVDVIEPPKDFDPPKRAAEHLPDRAGWARGQGVHGSDHDRRISDAVIGGG